MAIAIVGLFLGCSDDGGSQTDGALQPDAASSDGPVSGCVPEGLEQAPTEITGKGIVLDYSSSVLVAPGADCAGVKASDCETRLRLGLQPAAPDDPPHTELVVTVNGCSVGKLAQPGEDYFWTTQPGDPEIKMKAGRYLVVTVERQGEGIILRRTFQMPAAMPQLLAPAKGAAISPPVELKWNPLDLAGVPGTTEATLHVTAWESNGSMMKTDGSTVVSDADGQYQWMAGSSDWTSLQLAARLKYDGAVSFSLSYHQPVNN